MTFARLMEGGKRERGAMKNEKDIKL